VITTAEFLGIIVVSGTWEVRMKLHTSSLVVAAALLCGGSGHAVANEELAVHLGCFDCHQSNRTGSGPSIGDMAARYRGNKASREPLIEIVKHGGKGQWTALSKGAPMPPFSPRVSDEDIAKLVDWILSQ
jgi:cytochrome c551/c552